MIFPSHLQLVRPGRGTIVSECSWDIGCVCVEGEGLGCTEDISQAGSLAGTAA